MLFRGMRLFYSIIFILTFHLTQSQAQQLNMQLFHGMEARNIGPAGMSGRVTAIDVVRDNPDLMYIGTASGGVWRSASGGIDWQPIFDDQPVAAIGALAIDPLISDVIWVGTGEGNPRNSQSSGNGIYKSIDGGKTWQHLGLENSRNIHRIIIHPHNGDIVYACAQGSAWGEGLKRGIFKTVDGGKSWKKILYVDQKTGGADLVMDPSNPNKLIAGMWEYRRWPWFFKSGGPGSGLYVTFDGGETWQERTAEDGLPDGELGRIGLAISRSRPNVIYALIEAKKTALFRSDDGGYNWKQTADKNIGNRPFYYAEIYVDPENENRVYNLYSIVTVSEDGGKTFEPLIPWQKVHPDHHAWWIHPEDGDYIIDGNDGGLAISRDRGKTWRFVENLPLAQFYHINYDFEKPYHVYGGMQDNGSWRGPGRVYRHGGILNSYWEEVSFGDGFDVVPDSSNPRFGYTMSQGGWVRRYDLKTGYQKNIRPYHPEGEELRFNWNAAIAHDPFDTTTIYYGSQYLHKSSDRGDSWTIISPDLTTNDPEKQQQLESGGLSYDVTDAENYTTITAIAPSPLQKDLIWVGTDDGNVQLTKDGGANWTNLIGRIKGAPEGGWVPQIHPSAHDAGEAFAVINNYRQDNWTPYVFHTTDYGKNWKNIVDAEQVFGYALCFVQDVVQENLWFLGTESGLYISIDRGKNWAKWTAGFPTVSTMDLKVHPRENDLIVGTFGRAAYIIDNIQPLRKLAEAGAALLERPLHLFPVPDARRMFYKQAAGTRFMAEAMFRGENRPYGAMISYIVKPDTTTQKNSSEDGQTEKSTPFADSVKIEIKDAQKNVIRTLYRAPKAGFNRIYWRLDRKRVRFPNEPEPRATDKERGGPSVLPGLYTVHISYRSHSDSTQVQVKFDPRLEVDKNYLIDRHNLLQKIIAKIELATKAVDRLNEVQKTVDLISNRIEDREDSTAEALRITGKAIQDSSKKLIELINQKQVQGIRYDPTRVGARLSRVYRTVQSAFTPIGDRETVQLNLAENALQSALERINQFFAENWQAYRTQVTEADVSFFENYPPLE